MSRWSVPVVTMLIGGLTGAFVAGPVLHGQNAPTEAVAPVSGVSPAPVDLAVSPPRDVVSYRQIVKKVLPAVVSIESKVKPKKKEGTARRIPKLDDPSVPDEFRKFFEEFQKQPFQMPDEVPHTGFGSGFIVDPKGVILTNFHVVDGADQVEITFMDGRKLPSKQIHADRKTDLAIVRVDAKDPLPYLELGDSDQMEIGDRVLAVGAPFGLAGSVTSGIISGKGRSGLSMNLYEDFLQTDAAINPGNSGGPLINLDGKVIGINAAIKTRSGGFQGVGLAIASNLAKNVMTQLLTTGVVHRGYLGVQIQNLTPELADRLGLAGKHGVIVGQVFDGSPAGKGGVQSGDVITAVAGKSIKDGRELQRVVAGLPLKKPAEFTIVRDGKTQTVQVTIEEQPQDFGLVRNPGIRTPKRSESEDSVSLDKVGLQVTDLTSDMAEQLGFKAKAAGALITKVESDSPAEDAGLTRGLLITKVDKQPVHSAKDLKNYMDKAPLDKGVLLQVQTRQGETTYILLKAAATK